MCTTNLRILPACLLLSCLAACGAETGETIVFQPGEQPIGGFGVVSAQPEEARLREIAPKVAKVVSFRMPDEDVGYDEAAVAAAVGGTFEQVGFTKERLRDPALREQAYALFAEAADQPEKLTWFHCSTGNRASALWALYRAEVEGKPIDEAIADGKAAGLTELEPLVREILEGR